MKSKRTIFYRKSLLSDNAIAFIKQVGLTIFGAFLGMAIVVLTILALTGLQ